MDLLRILLPVLTMLGIGYLCKRTRLISDEGISGLQTIVMNFTLPVTLFYNFYNAKIGIDTLLFPVTFYALTVGGIFLGKLICKLAGETNPYLPFMLTGYEAGMLGYALFGLLFGNDKIQTYAMMDMGHGLAIFTAYIALLKATGGTKQTLGEAVKGILTTPVLIGILLGLFFGVSGLGNALASTSVGPVIDDLCKFISAPTSAVILVVIGYRMRFKGLAWKKITKAISLRIVEQLLIAGIVIGFFHLLGGVFAAPLTILSAIMMFILPPGFILPLLVKEEADKEFYSSTTSVYTLLSIIGFMVLAGILVL